MALQQQKGKSSTQGPSQEVTDLPPNPSDEIFKGRALPVRPPQAQTQRRAFSSELPTKNPLKYLDGPGTDEVVCSGRSYSEEHLDRLANSFGQEKPHPAPTSKTERGQEIRGSS